MVVCHEEAVVRIPLWLEDRSGCQHLFRFYKSSTTGVQTKSSKYRLLIGVTSRWFKGSPKGKEAQ